MAVQPGAHKHLPSSLGVKSCFPPRPPMSLSRSQSSLADAAGLTGTGGENQAADMSFTEQQPLPEPWPQKAEVSSTVSMSAGSTRKEVGRIEAAHVAGLSSAEVAGAVPASRHTAHSHAATAAWRRCQDPGVAGRICGSLCGPAAQTRELTPVSFFRSPMGKPQHTDGGTWGMQPEGIGASTRPLQSP